MCAKKSDEKNGDESLTRQLIMDHTNNHPKSRVFIKACKNRDRSKTVKAIVKATRPVTRQSLQFRMVKKNRGQMAGGALPHSEDLPEVRERQRQMDDGVEGSRYLSSAQSGYVAVDPIAWTATMKFPVVA